jgi:hypothetical protein
VSKINWPAVRNSLQKYIALEPEFRARFSAAPARYSTLSKTALDTVVRWQWYSDLFFELDPMHFVLSWGLKPGRPLKGVPEFKIGKVNYGFNAAGQVAVERKFCSSDEFRAYLSDRTEATLFQQNRQCINVQTLFLENSLPKAFFKLGTHGMYVRLYIYKGKQVSQVLEAHSPRVENRSPQWSIQVHDITYPKPGLARIATTHEKAPEENSTRMYRAPDAPKTKSSPPELNLRKDIAEITSLIAGTVKKFSKKLKKTECISGIGLVYQPFNNPEPEIYVNFDTRSVHEPDGTWTHEILETFPRAKWQKFLDACEEHGSGTLIDASGKEHKIKDIAEDERLVKWFGEALVQTLKDARKKGVFKALPKAARCELGVESIDGDFGWPIYKDRGKDNLL